MSEIEQSFPMFLTFCFMPAAQRHTYFGDHSWR